MTPSAEVPTPEILDALPRIHATLLVLRSAGATDAEIAERLGIPVESVPSVESVARRKLERLLDRTR